MLALEINKEKNKILNFNLLLTFRCAVFSPAILCSTKTNTEVDQKAA